MILHWLAGHKLIAAAGGALLGGAAVRTWKPAWYPRFLPFQPGPPQLVGPMMPPQLVPGTGTRAPVSTVAPAGSSRTPQTARVPQPLAAPPPGVSVAGTYTVVQGDTLSAIARRFGTTVAAITRANLQITDPNLIFPGQVIYLPAPTAASAAG